MCVQENTNKWKVTRNLYFIFKIRKQGKSYNLFKTLTEFRNYFVVRFIYHVHATYVWTYHFQLIFTFTKNRKHNIIKLHRIHPTSWSVPLPQFLVPICSRDNQNNPSPKWKHTFFNFTLNSPSPIPISIFFVFIHENHIVSVETSLYLSMFMYYVQFFMYNLVAHQPRISSLTAQHIITFFPKLMNEIRVCALLDRSRCIYPPEKSIFFILLNHEVLTWFSLNFIILWCHWNYLICEDALDAAVWK